MTDHERKILDRIQRYADQVLKDIDPQKVQISYQLEKLKPVMEQIAAEEKKPIEDIFILYMDLASAAAIEQEEKFQETIQDSKEGGDIRIFS